MVQSTVLSPCAQSGDCVPLEFAEVVWFPLAAGCRRAGTLSWPPLECWAPLYRRAVGTRQGRGRDGFVRHIPMPHTAPSSPGAPGMVWDLEAALPFCSTAVGCVSSPHTPTPLQGPSSRLPALLNSDIRYASFHFYLFFFLSVT